MKTIGVKFNKNGKVYHFNSVNEDVKNGDFVFVYTQEEYKVCLVVDDDIKYNKNHKCIMSIIEDTLPEILDYEIVELLKYNNIIYKNSIFNTFNLFNKSKWGRLKAYNNIIDGKSPFNSKKTKYIITFEKCEYMMKKIILKSNSNKFFLDFEEFNRNKTKLYPDFLQAFDNLVEYDEKYIDILKSINTSFIENKDNFFIHKPVTSFIKEFKNKTDLKVIFKKQIYECDDILCIRSYICNPKEWQDNPHFAELLVFLDEMELYLSDVYLDDDYLQNYYNTFKNYLDEVKDDLKYGDLGFNSFENIFDIFTYEEVSISDNFIEVHPIIKFKLLHDVDFFEFSEEKAFKFQTLDLEI